MNCCRFQNWLPSLLNAGHELVDWMQQIEAHRSELREISELHMARMSAMFAEFRGEIRSDLARVEAKLGTKIEQTRADLMKWSFVFWVGAVASIALLAG